MTAICARCKKVWRPEGWSPMTESDYRCACHPLPEPAVSPITGLADPWKGRGGVHVSCGPAGLGATPAKYEQCSKHNADGQCTDFEEEGE